MPRVQPAKRTRQLIGTRMLVALLALALSHTASAVELDAGASNPKQADPVESLLSKMTLAEKVGQLNMLSGSHELTGPAANQPGARELAKQITSGRVGAMLNVTGPAATRAAQKIAVEQSRLGIPMLFGYDVIHGYRTMFPIPIAESCSWDLDLMRRTARAAAVEASADGIHWTFAPMVDIGRDARWGRVMEGAGEDPYLASRVAAARVTGFQGDDLTSPNTVAACLKHFAAYGFAESGREYNTVDISRHTLQNTVLPPFRAGVDAGAATIMTAFNEVAGIPATADRKLLQGTLREDLRFNGLVLSDWASCAQLISHGYARDLKSAARSSFLAGCEMDMEGRAYIGHLVELVKSGRVPESAVDQAVRRVLELKVKLGLFKDPYLYCKSDTQESHDKLAREAARGSIVLLKNQDSLLPIADSVKSIAVIGPLASDTDTPLGSWRAKATPESAVSVLAGLQAALGDKVDIRYTKGCQLEVGDRDFTRSLKINEEDESGIAEAAALAAECDLVILAVGEDCFQSGEGRSRTRLDLPGVQPELVAAVTKANPNTVAVVASGRPLVLTDVADQAGALLQTWHLGSQSGHAIADVLTGRHNPSSKLTMCFPRSVGQTPIYYNHKNTGRPEADVPGMVFYSHYEDESNLPLYPFGYGLSYADFRYSNLNTSTSQMTIGEEVEVSVDLTNTSEVAGVEIAQLYIRDLYASRTRPVLQLRGWQRVALDPGETKSVAFQVGSELLRFRDENGRPVVEPGEFEIYVGPSSAELTSTRIHLHDSPHTASRAAE